MKRIFSDFAYGDAPRADCWWDHTVGAPDWPSLRHTLDVDVAVVGGGFTGVSAALHLAEQGARVAVFEANTPGWGASGRNGGFCCLGGSKLSSKAMTRRFGQSGADAFEQAEIDSVNLVAELIARHHIQADTHSRGETVLAHTKRAMADLRRQAETGGVLHEAAELPGVGVGGRFFGGLTWPKGFALNPRKYLFGLAKAAQQGGALLFQQSAVEAVQNSGEDHELLVNGQIVTARQVLFCTNGYSSEDLPSWLAGRFMPTQSSVMVTRPLTDAELEAQGWSTEQMCYDTRHLLHYFRLMPDRRFLFGMRGGILSSPRSETAVMARLRRHFDHLFPAWQAVETAHSWSGMVCLARGLMPYVGKIPGTDGLYTALAYHGNGVAMGTYCGRALARLVSGQPSGLPLPMTIPLERFPFGRFRRALIPPVYAAFVLRDL